MKKISVFLLLVAISCNSLQAQTCDIDIFKCDAKILQSVVDKTLSEIKSKEYSQLIPLIGEYFLETPYVAHTLEGETEVLTVNLRELDCTTFLENVVVISSLIKDENTDFESYLQRLKNIRYRNGEVDGYGSRIHYTSDWITTNEARGYVKNVTKEIGGESYDKTINFMTQNREKYAGFANEKDFEAAKAAEDNLNTHQHYYIPKAKVADIEKNIQNGDLIAITCKTKGLDVTHVGLAYKKNDRIHLMHASQTGKKVVISNEPLHNYLANINGNTGIMVARMIY
jgi:Protein of unknown function (DUF1460).